MVDVELMWSLAYVVLAALIVSPPTEFVAAGLTVQGALGGLLGSEQLGFVEYHLRRTTATMLLHSVLPLGYYIIQWAAHVGGTPPSLNPWSPWALPSLWLVFLALSLALPALVALLALLWTRQRWQGHPIVRALAPLAPPGSTWRAIASSINVEFRRIDKFTTGPPGRRVIVTDSWLILTSTYTLRVAHQRDIHLALVGSDEHALHYETSTSSLLPAQFLSLSVAGVNTRPFTIRLNATEYSDLREKLRSPVINARNVIVRQTLSDRFLEAFRHEVGLNERFRRPPNMGSADIVLLQELEPCIGCMQAESNVKLQRLCTSDPAPAAPPDPPAREGGPPPPCLHCHCRPMWCIDCMGKWFASRQDQTQPETWLGSKSPCPTCRATFCMLDVCLIV